MVKWLAETDEESVFLSVITFAEIRLGVEEMAAGLHRERLASWLDVELPARFEGRMVGVNLAVAGVWGRLMAQSNQADFNLSVMDALLPQPKSTGSRWSRGIRGILRGSAPRCSILGPPSKAVILREIRSCEDGCGK